VIGMREKRDDDEKRTSKKTHATQDGSADRLCSEPVIKMLESFLYFLFTPSQKTPGFQRISLSSPLRGKVRGRPDTKDISFIKTNPNMKS